MKKIVKVIAILAISTIMMVLSMSAANANEADVLTASRMGDAVALTSLSELDMMATANGYAIEESNIDGNVIRHYTAIFSGIKYDVALYQEEIVVSSVDLAGSLPGAITAAHVTVSGDAVAMSIDPKEILSIKSTWDEIIESLTEDGYILYEDGFASQLLKGDDEEGISIVKVGDHITVYNYGNGYGNLYEGDISSDTGFCGTHSICLMAAA